MAKRQQSTNRPDRRGRASTGKVATLTRSGEGFIRDGNRDLFGFYRHDVLKESLDLAVGDAVRFEVMEDVVNGSRAVRVARTT